MAHFGKEIILGLVGIFRLQQRFLKQLFGLAFLFNGSLLYPAVLINAAGQGDFNQVVRIRAFYTDHLGMAPVVEAVRAFVGYFHGNDVLAARICVYQSLAGEFAYEFLLIIRMHCFILSRYQISKIAGFPRFTHRIAVIFQHIISVAGKVDRNQHLIGCAGRCGQLADFHIAPLFQHVLVLHIAVNQDAPAAWF